MQIHQLKDTRFTSNVYLINSERPTLLDTGVDLKEKILQWISQILGSRKLAQIVFTHGHPDHIDHAAEIASHFGVPFSIHSGDSELLPDAQPLRDRVDCGQWQLEVIHTPGHSHGGVCFYEPQQKILFSGDTIFPGGRTGRWDLPTAQYDDLLKSVERLLELDINSLYPGHHNPIEGNVRAHLEASLETLKQIGPQFDDAKYDARIAEVSSELS